MRHNYDYEYVRFYNFIVLYFYDIADNVYTFVLNLFEYLLILLII